MAARRTLPSLCLGLVLGMSAGLASATPSDPSKSKSPEPLHVIQGCIAGGIVKGVTSDAQATTLAIPPGSSLRLAGPKAIVQTLRKEHSGHTEELTGHLKGSFAPPSMGARKEFGKLSVTVGGQQGPLSPNTPGVPDMPAFEVQSFRHVAGTCGG